MLQLVLGLWAGTSSGLGFTTNSSWLVFLRKKKKHNQLECFDWQWSGSWQDKRASHSTKWGYRTAFPESRSSGGRERERERVSSEESWDLTELWVKSPLIPAGSRKAVSAHSPLCPPRVSSRSGTVDLALVTPLESHSPLSVKDNSQGIRVPVMSVRKSQSSQS